MNPGYKDSFSWANNLYCQAVLVQAPYNDMLPPPDTKES
jgi:hypothetical protein